ncbi:MAG: nucleoside deaminase [Pedobacter sp.]|nr:MAG: nucleoside deaminase [Pedobacter sp.]
MSSAVSPDHRLTKKAPDGMAVRSKNKVIGRGHNLTERLNDVTAHAEMQAMTAATQTLGGKYLQDCTLYVTIEPCVMCAGASYWMQLDRIVYGAREPKRGYLSKAPNILHPKTQLTGGVLELEAAQLMKEFFGKMRR